QLHLIFSLLFFFFSSRRRHTRFSRDWSSTCALPIFTKTARVDDRAACLRPRKRHAEKKIVFGRSKHQAAVSRVSVTTRISLPPRSEERRVGKECRSRWWPSH